MKAALKKLLDTLDSIAETHGEVQDTDVCEALADTLDNAFIHQTPRYVVPASFGMFTPAGDALVHAALSEFVSTARDIARLRTAQQRRYAFQDRSTVTAAGHTYRDYFGHVDDEDPFLAVKKREEEFGFKPDDGNA
jgi:hypothetical protein